MSTRKMGGENPMWDNNTFWRSQKKTQDHFLFLVVFLTIVAFVFSRQRYLQVNSLMMNEDHRSFRGKQKFVAYKNNIYEGEKRPERKRKRKREEKADIPYSFNNTQNPLPSQPQANSRPASPEKKKSHFALSLSLSFPRSREKERNKKVKQSLEEKIQRVSGRKKSYRDRSGAISASFAITASQSSFYQYITLTLGGD